MHGCTFESANRGLCTVWSELRSVRALMEVSFDVPEDSPIAQCSVKCWYGCSCRQLIGHVRTWTARGSICHEHARRPVATLERLENWIERCVDTLVNTWDFDTRQHRRWVTHRYVASLARSKEVESLATQPQPPLTCTQALSGF